MFFGVAIFTPILPWSGRYDYVPIWEGVAAVAKVADYKSVDSELLKQKYEKKKLSSDEVKCLIGRDVIFNVLEHKAIYTNSLGNHFGLRSSSVPVFLAANTVMLSVFTEWGILDFKESLIYNVANKCRNYPGRFASRADLDYASQ